MLSIIFLFDLPLSSPHLLSTHQWKWSFQNANQFMSLLCSKAHSGYAYHSKKKLHLSMTYKARYNLSILTLWQCILLLLTRFTPYSLVFCLLVVLSISQKFPKYSHLKAFASDFLLSLLRISFSTNSSFSFKYLQKFLILRDIYDIGPLHTQAAHLPSHYSQKFLMPLTSIFSHSTS